MKNIKTKKILLAVIFAVAFGFVEAAVVIYLRQIFEVKNFVISEREVLTLPGIIAFLEPKATLSIITNKAILNVEIVREAATLLMIYSIAALLSNNLRQKIAYFFLVFGIWDIFYYIFLKILIDWPKSFSELDIFFLLPVPWAGPVFVPILISSLLVFGSARFILFSKTE